ncbi:MAG: beta-N-acetylhexosaminidase [Alcanivorax sp.]|nr:beta-N-acetylhexosaminidase [Alcanivorax sp.]
MSDSHKTSRQMPACPGLVMLDIAGTSLDDTDRTLLANPLVGGLILFARNIRDRAQLCALTAEIRALRPDMLIAVDQEGGRVQRFRDGFVRLPPMAALGKRYDEDAEQALADSWLLGRLMAEEVLACDVDISFAPVLDIDHGRSDIMGDRCFYHDAEGVTALAGAFVAGMQDAGMAATGKHFPGHGYAEADSHLALPVDERDMAALRGQDLIPFARLAQQLTGIMPAHIVYDAVDPLPAGFSRLWLQQVLRAELGFNGVIFSDDLSMAGAAMAGGYPERARAALEAGCDMVLVCNDRPGALQVIRFLETRLPALDLPAQPVAASCLLASAGTRMSGGERAEAQALAEALCTEAGII